MVSYITLSAARLQRLLLLKTTTDIKKKRTLVLLCVKLKVQDFFWYSIKEPLHKAPFSATLYPYKMSNKGVKLISSELFFYERTSDLLLGSKKLRFTINLV